MRCWVAASPTCSRSTSWPSTAKFSFGPRSAGVTAFTDAEVEVVLTELALNGTLHDPGPAAKAPPDAGDRHVWALLEDAPAAVLVTGDDALRRRAPEPTRVLSPRLFLVSL